jgi:hypothetical protein
MTNFVDVFGGQVTPPSEYGYQATTIASNTTAYWPYNYAGTGLVLAKNNDITASAASLALTLPNATEVSTGEDFVVKNAGSNSFEVKDNAGNTLTTILAGVAKYFVLTNNSTAAGVYDVTTFGTGTSSADAGILAGAGHRVDGDAIDNIVANNSIGASYTISTTDNATTLVYKAGTATLALPNPASLYNGYYFIFINEGTGTVTLDPTASVTIDSSLTKDLQPGESCIVTTDGVLYYTAGYGRSNTYVWTQLTVDLTGLSAYTVTSTQAQNKLWYFFNTPTGSMTVTIPAVASVYFLRVGAIGAYTLTFSTGSGATVGLTANQSYIIYCDGTNITAAQTVAVTSTLSLNDGSVASPTLYFTLDTDTGLYRVGNNQLGIATGGVQSAYFATDGLHGNVTGNISGTATNATNVGITDDTATASTVYPTWVTATTGNLPEKVSSTKLTFQPSTGTLTAPIFAGAVTGTATNATNVGITDDTATASTVYPTWVTATTGNLPEKVSSTKLTFQPSTGTLTAPIFAGALSGNAATAGKSTNLIGGSTGAVPYQSAVDTTTYLTPGTNGYVLTTQGPGLPPVWSAGVPAATAGNIIGGGAGQVLYQIATNSTGFTTVGVAGQVLTSNGTSAPSWGTISLNTVTGYLDILGTAVEGANIKLYEDTDNGTNYVSFKAPNTIATNVTWTLPDADGVSSQVLTTNGAGTLTWTTPSVGVSTAKVYFMGQF